METKWQIETHGDPLGAVRNLTQKIWSDLNLAAMLVPIDGTLNSVTRTSLINNPSQLIDVNPFKPLMTINSARLLPDLVHDFPEESIGAMLRPCEARALIEMAKHNGFDTANLVTICIDCLGTLPLEDYQWRAERKKSTEDLTSEALQFARQGGIVAYRYRSACQMCASPEARGADINIHVLGLPVRQYILVNSRDQGIAAHLELNKITDGPANSELVIQHERILAKLTERNQRTMERLSQTLAEFLPANIEALMQQLEGCTSCKTCMQVCPICTNNLPERDENGHYIKRDFERWLISCAGCGMCEQSCPNHLPLSAIFGHIRMELSKEWGYTPGLSLDEPLPIM